MSSLYYCISEDMAIEYVDSLLHCHVHIMYTSCTTRNAVMHTQLNSHPNFLPSLYIFQQLPHTDHSLDSTRARICAFLRSPEIDSKDYKNRLC